MRLPGILRSYELRPSRLQEHHDGSRHHAPLLQAAAESQLDHPQSQDLPAPIKSHQALFGVKRVTTQFWPAVGMPRSFPSPQTAMFSQLTYYVVDLASYNVVDLASNSERLCITVSTIDLTSSKLQQDAALSKGACQMLPMEANDCGKYSA